MRNHLSFCEILIAVVLTAVLSAPQAIAQLSDYSTDMGEPDIITVKNNTCCKTEALRKEAYVQLNISHALYRTAQPVSIEVLDASNEEVAHVSTRDEIVYMHLPEGKYTIKVNAILDRASLNVVASDETLKECML